MSESKITVKIRKDSLQKMLQELRRKTDDWVNIHECSPTDDLFRLIKCRNLKKELELTYIISKSVKDPRDST